MNLDEWNAHLDHAPATPNQVGAIHREAARLGLGDRGERLAACARLLDLDGLASTRELTQGQAGKLVGILRRTRDRAELPDAVAAAPVDAGQLDGEQDDPGPDGGAHQDDGGHQQQHGARYPATWPEVIALAIALAYVAVTKQPGDGQSELGNVANERPFNSARDGRLPAHPHQAAFWNRSGWREGS